MQCLAWVLGLLRGRAPLRGRMQCLVWLLGGGVV